MATLEYGKSLRGYEQAKGKYRVFGTNGPIGWHDEYLYGEPSVIIGRKGAYRGVHYTSEPFYVIDTAFYLKPKSEFDMRWAYYQLLTQDINGMDSGSAIPSTSRESFYRLPVLLPPLEEQQRIADTLEKLDEKIELNRRMNATLEQMAQALFKSWFVDFDPVKAKAEGRAPEGMDEETAALFPNEIEESEMGPIPKGWKVQEIKSLASSIQYGLTQSAKSEPIGPWFLRITDIQGGKVHWETVPYCYASDEEIARYQIGEGDILVARTGASTGENIYIVNPPFAVFASYLVRFRFSTLHTARLVAAFMRSESYFDYVKGCIGGSAQPNANAQILSGAYLVFPGDEIAKRFYDALRSMDVRCVENRGESQTLAQLRDALLTRLISGRLRISDAERIAEAAL